MSTDRRIYVLTLAQVNALTEYVLRSSNDCPPILSGKPKVCTLTDEDDGDCGACWDAWWEKRRIILEDLK